MTGRLPFDPSKMAAARSKPKVETALPTVSAGGDPPPLSVSQVAALIDTALRTTLPAKVRVIGQVSNFTDRTHWYFALKDADAVISCVMFQGRARSTVFTPADGHEVVATGKVEFYKPQGRLTFVVEKIEPVGAGALEIAFRALCAELKGLGYFDPARKRPLPTFPRRVAIVTSRSGAALQDVLDTMRRRCPAVDAVLVDVLVQGESAAPAVANALNWLSREHRRLGVDVVLVTRGGGSTEDLWAFNDRTVADAIFRSVVPVVAAIGHETDTTIAELVADERCATPTAAAMRLTPDRAALAEQTDLAADRLAAVLRRALADRTATAASTRRHLPALLGGALQTRARRLEQLATRLETLRPAAVYAARRADIAQRAADLRSAFRHRLTLADLSPITQRLLDTAGAATARRAEALTHLTRQLDLIGPLGVLRRGYSVTVDPHGRAIRSPADVRPGDHLTTRLESGQIVSIVEGTDQPSPRKPASKRSKPDSTPDLFG